MARTKCVKLTAQDVLFILESTESNQALGQRFGVSRQAISLIRNGKTWTDIAPEIPRIPVRLVNNVRKDYPAAFVDCRNCVEYVHGECSFGFPEAIDEPEFAAACQLFKRNQDHP